LTQSSSTTFGRSLSFSSDSNNLAIGYYHSVWVYSKNKTNWDWDNPVKFYYTGSLPIFSIDNKNLATYEHTGLIYIYKKTSNVWDQKKYQRFFISNTNKSWLIFTSNNNLVIGTTLKPPLINGTVNIYNATFFIPTTTPEPPTTTTPEPPTTITPEPPTTITPESTTTITLEPTTNPTSTLITSDSITPTTTSPEIDSPWIWVSVGTGIAIFITAVIVTAIMISKKLKKNGYTSLDKKPRTYTCCESTFDNGQACCSYCCKCFCETLGTMCQACWCPCTLGSPALSHRTSDDDHMHIHYHPVHITHHQPAFQAPSRPPALPPGMM
jgi:hypothetical protein